jgi:hypothetical protein
MEGLLPKYKIKGRHLCSAIKGWGYCCPNISIRGVYYKMEDQSIIQGRCLGVLSAGVKSLCKFKIIILFFLNFQV